MAAVTSDPEPTPGPLRWAVWLLRAEAVGLALLTLFLVVHVWKYLNADVGALYFHSTPLWLGVMALATVIYLREVASLRRRGVAPGQSGEKSEQGERFRGHAVLSAWRRAAVKPNGSAAGWHAGARS